jgi:allophanate hydrolase
MPNAASLAQLPFTLDALADAYRTKRYSVADVAREALRRATDPRHPNVWIRLLPAADLLARAAALDARDPADPALPLYGVPFAIKDNIDLAGLPTTCACRALDTPENAATADATVVARLIAAGALPIGKTNLDQFATGLVGTRSPYGACASVFSPQHISGGSSSGSAVAVAAGMTAFALGTDTAGSGRVPAAFNGITGLKPTRGLVPTTGVFPACKSLDCVSIFARTPAETAAILRVAAPPRGTGETPLFPPAAPLRIGIPPAAQLRFFGDTAAAQLFTAAARRIADAGHTLVEIDYAPFAAAAALLYSGPWVAERLWATGKILDAHRDAFDPVVRDIIASGAKHTAVDAFAAAYALDEHRAAAAREWAKMDILLLPTTGTIYTHAQIAADPVALNSNLGYYTNFVNLLDLTALAVPADTRSDGNANGSNASANGNGNGSGDGSATSNLPFGVTYIAPAGRDYALVAFAESLTATAPPANKSTTTAAAAITLAVVGAHLRGQPLNTQLTDRAAVHLETTRTAANYRLFKLADGKKPGLLRTPETAAAGIEVELWALTPEAFGSFVALVPPPLGIGTVTLSDGRQVKGFICEPYALLPENDITPFGSWRAWLARGRPR